MSFPRQLLLVCLVYGPNYIKNNFWNSFEDSVNNRLDSTCNLVIVRAVNETHLSARKYLVYDLLDRKNICNVIHEPIRSKVIVFQNLICDHRVMYSKNTFFNQIIIYLKYMVLWKM